MPPTTQKQIRAIACAQIDDLHVQLKKLETVFIINHKVDRTEILKQLRAIIVLSHEARALLRVTTKDVTV